MITPLMIIIKARVTEFMVALHDVSRRFLILMRVAGMKTKPNRNIFCKVGLYIVRGHNLMRFRVAQLMAYNLLVIIPEA